MRESYRALRDSLPGIAVTGGSGRSYRLDRCVGEGGQGWVFRAEAGGATVVVKLLHPDAVDSRSLRRFQREAGLLRELGEQPSPCRNIVRFHDHGIARVRHPSSSALVLLPFTVLEHVPGPTLAQALAESSRRGFAVARVHRIALDVCAALRIVHARHVIHRDLKPSNVLLTVDGVERAKVTDFGFARFADISPLTTSIATGVTHGYAAPEQYEKGNPRVSVRTDVFSLGAIVWEMLAGRPAFPIADNETMIQLVARMNRVRPSLARDTAFLAQELIENPHRLHAIDVHLQRALAPEPMERQGSIDELEKGIEALLQ